MKNVPEIKNKVLRVKNKCFSRLFDYLHELFEDGVKVFSNGSLETFTLHYEADPDELKFSIEDYNGRMFDAGVSIIDGFCRDSVQFTSYIDKKLVISGLYFRDTNQEFYSMLRECCIIEDNIILDRFDSEKQLVWLTTSMGSNNFKQLYTERLAEGVNNNIRPCCDAMMAHTHIEAVKQNMDLYSMIEQKKYERNLYEYSDYINLGKAVSQGLLDGIKDTTFTRCSDRCTFVDSMKTPDGHKLFKVNGEMRNLFCSGFDLKHKESIKTNEFLIHSEYPIYVDELTNSLYVLDYDGVRRDLEFIGDCDNRMQVVIGDVYFMFSLRFPSSWKYTELRSFMKGKKEDYGYAKLIDSIIIDRSEHMKNGSRFMFKGIGTSRPIKKGMWGMPDALFITDDILNARHGIEEVKLYGDILRINFRGVRYSFSIHDGECPVRYTKCCYSNQFGSYAGKYILFETDSFGHIKVQYSNTYGSYFIRYKDDVRVEFLGKTDTVDIYSVGDTGIYVHMY